MIKYVVYATNEHGEGLCQKIGEYRDLADINIHIGMLKEDVVISIAAEEDDE